VAKLPPHFFVYGAVATGLLGGGIFALSQSIVYPWQLWFIDMMDSDMVKAYEVEMRLPAEGSIPRDYRPYGEAYPQSMLRLSAAGQAIENPYTVDDELLAKGEWGYSTYCTPCHSADANGNGPVGWNKPDEGQKRFQVPIPGLIGDQGRLHTNPLTTDGYIYLTIRNGGGVMPSYGVQLSDEEIWGIVAHLRKLDKS